MTRTVRNCGIRPDSRGRAIHDLAVIGAPGEDKRKPVHACPNYGVLIGDGVTIREFVTVHGGFEDATVIGPRCYVTAHCHVGHDCRLDEDVFMATQATLGGHTIVHKGANIGLGAITHQRTTIGAYAMIGMGAVVTKDVPPFTTWYGNPARMRGFNRVGMERAGFSSEEIFEIEHGKRTEWHDLFDREAGRR
jgi:UDP-N-acetylglucosamine acyltransferase